MSFEDIKKNFGFGCMRLPMADGEVDEVEFTKMVDTFIERGFNYFDTAHPYIEGKSEKAIKKCLTSRYPREDYILTNKLSNSFFESEEEIRPLIDTMLDECGVEYFDFLLMHALNAKSFEKYKRLRAFETALELKKEGKIRHLGMSFHDTAEVLDRILTQYPEVEAVQIQFNYLDYTDPNIQSRECYEVCRKHNKPIIVMEPVKGGTLALVPEKAQTIFDDLGSGSPASVAIRYAASQEGVFMVLSGMSNMDQMEDNISHMEDFEPVNEREKRAIARVAGIIKDQDIIGCTSCRYCTESCPMQILIPDLFSCFNTKKVFNDEDQYKLYHEVYTVENGKASDCIKCGQCEEQCPQNLKIRELLVDVANEFEGANHE